MISFKEYLLTEASDTKTGNYVSVKQKFPDFVKDMDVSTGKIQNDPHITLVYSKEQTVQPHKLLEVLKREFKDYGVARITSAAVFGEEDGVGCIVLKLNAPLLAKINTALVQFADIKHSYQKYEPHLTLFYDVNLEEARYWADVINDRYVGEMIQFKGFESTTIIEDWNE